MNDLTNLIPHTIAARAAFMASLETETRNRQAGPFKRLSIEETKRRDGCTAITSHPFTLVLVDGDRVVACLMPGEHGGMVRWAPYSVKAAYLCITAADVARCRKWGETKAQAMREAYPGVRFEVWAADALRHYGADLVEAAKADDVLGGEG